MSPDAVILCGGLGTRLRSAVSDKPKCLAPIRGIPFLRILVAYLKKQNIEHFILCTGYRGEMVKEEFRTEIQSGEVSISREEEPLGTGGAIKLALPHIRSNDFLTLNGDSFADFRISDLLQFHRATASACATITLLQSQSQTRYGLVHMNAKKEIVSFREKAVASESKVGYINAGIYVMRKQFFQTAVKNDSKFSLETEFFPRHTGNGLRGHVISENTAFIDIGIPESYFSASATLAPFFSPQTK